MATSITEGSTTGTTRFLTPRLILSSSLATNFLGTSSSGVIGSSILMVRVFCFCYFISLNLSQVTCLGRYPSTGLSKRQVINIACWVILRLIGSSRILQRLNQQHNVLRRVLGRNYIGPVQEILQHDPNRRKYVVDLGTGTGIWSVVSVVHAHHTMLMIIQGCRDGSRV